MLRSLSNPMAATTPRHSLPRTAEQCRTALDPVLHPPRTPAARHSRRAHVHCDAASDSSVSSSGRVDPPAKPFIVKFFDSADPEHVVEVPVAPPRPQPARPAASQSTALALSGTDGNAALVPGAKDIMLQKALVQQLGDERNKVAQLQQYELMYRETRMSSERLKGEVVSLQDLVSRKDAELARSYGAMSESAAERATLRKQYTASQDSITKLHAQLEEAKSVVAQLRAVLPPGKSSGNGATPIAALSSASSSSSPSSSNSGNGSSSSSSSNNNSKAGSQAKAGPPAGANVAAASSSASSSSPPGVGKGGKAGGGRDGSAAQHAVQSPTATSVPQPISVLSELQGLFRVKQSKVAKAE